MKDSSERTEDDKEEEEEDRNADEVDERARLGAVDKKEGS